MGCNKHSVPKGKETVAFLHSFPVGIQYVLPSCQRTDQHHQCGLGQMEIRNQGVQYLKAVARINEYLCPSSVEADSTVLQLVVPTQITRPPAALVSFTFFASDSSTI